MTDSLVVNEWSDILLEYLPSGVLVDIFKYLTWQDILRLGRTCRRFNEICRTASIWFQLNGLDFTRCAIPYDYKILSVIKKCPQIEDLKLCNVLLSSEDNDEEDEGQATPADRFLLEVLRCTSKLIKLSLSMEMLTDHSVNVICAKCERLRSLTLAEAEYISNEGVVNLLSYLPQLTQFHIISCTNMIPMIKHEDEGHHLGLRDVRIENCSFFKANLQVLLRSCLQLKQLTLVQNLVLQGFPNFSEEEQTGLKTLKHLRIYSQSDFRNLNFSLVDELETIKIKDCHQLIQINMQAPKLRSFQIQNCASLSNINFYNVHLSEIDMSGFEALALFSVDSPVLKSINISGCTSLSAHQFLVGVPNKRPVEHINIAGCSKITPADIDSILKEFPNLTSFVFGGEHLTNAEINSVHLTEVTFKSNKIMSILPLNIHSLKVLKLENCSGLAENYLMDGLLFGERKSHGVEGLESLMKDFHDYTPFKGRLGVPSIETLVLQQVPGIQGTRLSDSLPYFKKLSELQIRNCVCLKTLDIHDLRVLSVLTIENCNHLSTVRVHGVPNLRNMTLKWCSMINEFHADNTDLHDLDVTGCNFAHFHLHSDTLSELNLSGVCTQPNHTISLRCPKLTELSINKCNALDDVTLHRLFADNPGITSVTLSVSDQIRYISIPSGVTSFSVTALKRLQAVSLEQPIKIDHLKLNNLIKFTPESRIDLLRTCASSLVKLEVRAIPKEQDLCLQLPNLMSLTLDQGIDLLNLEILCPKLEYLRIQGCPRLNHLVLQLNKLSQVKVKHSSPLLALKTMELQSFHIEYLANILAHYTPNLTTLVLKGSSVTEDYLCDLGKAINKLTSVDLVDCDLDNDLQQLGGRFTINGSECEREFALKVNINSPMDVG